MGVARFSWGGGEPGQPQKKWIWNLDERKINQRGGGAKRRGTQPCGREPIGLQGKTGLRQAQPVYQGRKLTLKSLRGAG